MARNILITGGSSGIGLAAVELLRGNGHLVFNADKDAPPLPSDPHHVGCDITDPSQVAHLFDRVHALIEAPDVLILNAGQGIHEKLAEGDPEKWARVIDINIMGTLRVLRAFLPGMLLREAPQVIFISSVAATAPYTYGGIYSATKAAIETIARTLEAEEGSRVRVTIVRPGVADTPFFDNMISGTHGVDEIGWGSTPSTFIAEQLLQLVSLPHDQKISILSVQPAKQAGLA